MECAKRLNRLIDNGQIVPEEHGQVSDAKRLEKCVYFLKKVLTCVDVDLHSKDLMCFLSHLNASICLRELAHALSTVQEGFRKSALSHLLVKVINADFLAKLLAERFSRQQVRAISQLITNLPSKVANELKLDLPEFFNVERYPSLLTRACCARINELSENLRQGKDTYLGLLGALVGRLGVHYPETFDELVQFFLSRPEDFVFRRVVHRLIVDLPVDLKENAIVLICYRTPCFKQMDWLLEDSITRDANIEYILTKKLLLGRYFSNDRVLRNVVGYLCSSPSRRKLASQTAVELFHTWSDKVLMKYQTVEQQKYLTCALLTFVGFVKADFYLDEPDHDKCIQACLVGIQNHLSEPDEVLRDYGMIVGREFLAVMRSDVKAPDFPIHVSQYKDIMSFLDTPSEKIEPITLQKAEPQFKPKTGVDSDDDSEPNNDDDLVYQIDPQCKIPLYLRDCLRLMVPDKDGENIEQAKICLEHLPQLIVRYPEELRDIAVDLCRLVLYAEECPRVFPQIASLKRESLVLLLIHAPIPSSTYLTDQFYSLHVSHTQRLEILSAITLASDRYVKELTFSGKNFLVKPKAKQIKSSNIIRSLDQLTAEPRKIAEYSGDDFDINICEQESSDTVERHWKEVVDKRISSKTRKITSKTEISTQENRFGEVAGHFFYPLMRPFTSETYLRVHDVDSFLLVKLLETLGVIMSSARHTPRAYQMGRTLLQFASAFRYHDHEPVRRACFFAIASVFTSVPEELLDDENQLGLEAAELGPWLNTVATNAPSLEVKVSSQIGPSLLTAKRIQELT